MSKEKQIEEIARYCCNACDFGNQIDLENNIIPCAIDNEHKTCPLALETAEMIYNAGYRKQSEGEWVQESFKAKNGETLHHTPHCSICGNANSFKTAYCPNCGAKMKGGAE